MTGSFVNPIIFNLISQKQQLVSRRIGDPTPLFGSSSMLYEHGRRRSNSHIPISHTPCPYTFTQPNL